MDLEIFRDLGLTDAEIKVYISLLELGESNVGNLLIKLKLQSSVIHRALNSLIEKGLISFISERKRRLYSAINPENFFDFIEEKKERFKKILPELKQKQNKIKSKKNAFVFKGIKGLKEVYNLLINLKEKEYLTYGGGDPCVKKMGETWWLNLHRKRVFNKLKSRQIFDKSVKEIGGEIEKLKLTRIKYLPEEFSQFQETVIIGYHVAINVFGEEPYSLLIQDKNVAEGYKKQFELLWKKAD